MPRPTPPPDPATVHYPGPWRHRVVSANGLRLHVAECSPEVAAGAARHPLVLMLHGDLDLWWTWHRCLPPVAEAGFQAVAVDLRGYGDSDKPPRGYDPLTTAADMSGLIRALGYQSAHLVAHGAGALTAWTMARRVPGAVASLTLLSGPHPRSLRANVLHSATTAPSLVASMMATQIPRWPERRLAEESGTAVTSRLRRLTAPGFLDTPLGAEAAEVLSAAARIPKVANTASEYARWRFRSSFRPDGARYLRSMRRRLTVPAVHLLGDLDPTTTPEIASESARWTQPYELRVLPGVGYYTPLEAPEVVSAAIIEQASSHSPPTRH